MLLKLKKIITIVFMIEIILLPPSETVNAQIKRVSLDTKKINMCVDDKIKLKLGKHQKYCKKIEWYSTNEKVLTINKKAVIHAKKAGISKIVVKIRNKRIRVTVNVKNKKDINRYNQYFYDDEILFQLFYGLDNGMIGNYKPSQNSFNYVICTITNNSQKDIVINNNLEIYCDRWYKFRLKNDNALIPKNSTKVLVFNNYDVVSDVSDVYCVYNNYMKNGKKINSCYFLKDEIRINTFAYK